MFKSHTANAATADTLPRQRWWLALLPHLSARARRAVVIACLSAAMLTPALGRLHSAPPPPSPTNPTVQNALHHLSLSTPDGPIGDQFQINSYTTAAQTKPAVAADSEGNFVVVWTSAGSSGSDTDGTSIQAQRYNAAGVPQGSQFQVNSYTTNTQQRPNVAMDSDGDFVVVWESRGSGGSDNEFYSIQGQRYNAAGVAQGSQFQVNTYTQGRQTLSKVAMDSDGDFVVTWMSYGSPGSDTDDTSIQAQRYNAAGVPQGSQFQVNTITSGYQRFPAVALDSDGDFVIVWDSNHESGTNRYSTQGQRYNATGTPLGSEFQASENSTFSRYNPAVAMDSDGNFVVIWDNAGPIGVQGQRYNSAGTAQGSNFQVNNSSTDGPRNMAVAMDSDGDFVVIWESITVENEHTIQGRGYNAAGVPQGSQFQVNSYTSDKQRYPAVAINSDGEFVVVWDSLGSPGPGPAGGTDTSEYSIQGQRFSSVVVSFTDHLYLPAIVRD